MNKLVEFKSDEERELANYLMQLVQTLLQSIITSKKAQVQFDQVLNEVWGLLEDELPDYKVAKEESGHLSLLLQVTACLMLTQVMLGEAALFKVDGPAGTA